MKRLLLGLACCVLVSTLHAELPVIEPYHDWPVIQAPADPPRHETLTLQPVWQLDCGEDAEHLIGKIVSAAPGLDGRVLLVDRQLCQVMVMGIDGEVEETVGRCGEGPGEFEGCFRVFQLLDGRIGVASGTDSPDILFDSQGKVILLNMVGDPAGVWLAGGDPCDMPLTSVREMRYAGGGVLTVTQRIHFSPPIFRTLREIGLLDPATGERVPVVRHVREANIKSEDTEYTIFEPLANGRADVDALGRIAFAPERDQWKLAIREPDGSGVVISRPFEAVERTEEDFEVVLEELGDGGYEMADDHPMIRRIRWRPDGNLWVEPWGVKPADNALACFDEIGPAGGSLRRVHLTVPGARQGDEVLLMEDGRFVLLRGFGEPDEGEDLEDVSPAVMLLELPRNAGSHDVEG